MNKTDQSPIIIIGSGLAGYNVAREFRKLDSASQLVIISADNAEFYSKPMLSNALEKNKSAEEDRRQQQGHRFLVGFVLVVGGRRQEQPKV